VHFISYTNIVVIIRASSACRVPRWPGCSPLSALPACLDVCDGPARVRWPKPRWGPASRRCDGVRGADCRWRFDRCTGLVALIVVVGSIVLVGGRLHRLPPMLQAAAMRPGLDDPTVRPGCTSPGFPGRHHGSSSLSSLTALRARRTASLLSGVDGSGDVALTCVKPPRAALRVPQATTRSNITRGAPITLQLSGLSRSGAQYRPHPRGGAVVFSLCDTG